MKFKSFAGATALAGAMALATSASAAPVTSHTLALKNGATSDVVQVRSRGAHRAGVAAGIGLAAGSLIGAAATANAWGPYAYDYGYGPYAYDYGYDVGPGVFAGPAPAVVGPAPFFAGPRLGPPQGIPGSVCGSGSCSAPANPALGTINGATAVD